MFLQANFGARRELRIAGVSIGLSLTDDNPQEDTDWFAPVGAGSVIGIVATDAPLLPGQAKALARHVSLGIARTGTSGSHFSGDIFLAFSTANPGALDSVMADAGHGAEYRTLQFVPWQDMDRLYRAVVEATEEAVINALVAADSMLGVDDRRIPGLPVDRVRELLAPVLIG